MIAFFFTMPISMIMPTNAYRFSSRPEQQQREQRAEPGRRQPGQDRDRVDEALVEHPQHEVDHDHRAISSSSPAPAATRWNACAVPWKLGGHVGRQLISRAMRCDRGRRRRPATPPARRSNDSVTDGSWPGWLTVSGPTSGGRTARPRRAAPAARPGRADVELGERARVALELRLHLQDHPVLVGRRVDGRHLARRRRRWPARPRSAPRSTPSGASASRSISTSSCGLRICRSLVTSWSSGSVAHAAPSASAPRRTARRGPAPAA